MSKNEDNYGSELKKEQSFEKSSKFDFELYKAEDDKVERVIRVKKSLMPNNGVKWKIFINEEVRFTIASSSISKKERSFLQTLEGFNFIISHTKQGFKSLNHFRKEMKKQL